MIFRLTFSVLLLFILFLPGRITSSPIGPEDDILRPVPFRMYLGVLAGIGYNYADGRFQTLCDCEYDGGDGIGPLFGAVFEYSFGGNWAVSTQLTMQSLYTSYKKTDTRIDFFESSNGGGEFVPVDYELNTEVDLWYVNLAVLGKWQTNISGLYIAAGPAFGLLASGQIKETETIMTPGIGYQDDHQTEQVIMDGDMDEYYSTNTLRVSIQAGVGFEIPLSQALILAPELMFSVPVTPVVSEHSAWKINAVQLSVLLKFGL